MEVYRYIYYNDHPVNSLDYIPKVNCYLVQLILRYFFTMDDTQNL